MTPPMSETLNDRAGYEWEALGLMSFTGDGRGGWQADLDREDVEQIRDLINELAAELRKSQQTLREAREAWADFDQQKLDDLLGEPQV